MIPTGPGGGAEDVVRCLRLHRHHVEEPLYPWIRYASMVRIALVLTEISFAQWTPDFEERLPHAPRRLQSIRVLATHASEDNMDALSAVNCCSSKSDGNS